MEGKQRYHNTIVQVCDVNHQHHGCGFLVGEQTIVTCSHVVALALGYEVNVSESELPEGATVMIRRPYCDGFESKPIKASMLSFSPRSMGNKEADICFLNIEEDPYYITEELSICSFAIPEKPIGISIYALGFPADISQTIEGSAAAYYEIKDVTGIGWYVCEAKSKLGNEIRSGFSGGPIMDEDTGQIIGMVVDADATRRVASVLPVGMLNEVRPFTSIHQAVEDEDKVDLEPVKLRLTKPGFRWFLDHFTPKLHYFLTERLGLLSTPEETRYLRNYLRNSKTSWENELRKKTYVPPPARDLPELAPAYKRLKKSAFFSPIQQLIKELISEQQGGDSSSAQISVHSKQTRKIRNILRRLRRVEKPIILLGEPGSGKSLTLKKTAIEFCHHHLSRVFPSVCIFVPLGRWKPVRNPNVEDVKGLVREYTPPEINSIIYDLAVQKRLVIIFDGLDEMSRYKYTEHTQALSDFADNWAGEIRTLFSCRIADFSPAFIHHRMVLLPFQRSHIRSYLNYQFGNNTLLISGEELTIKELSKRLDTESLVIQPHNPFALWLLSLYLGQQQKWPDSRVELLQYSFEYQYEQKKKDKQDTPFIDRDQAFYLWSKLAFKLTERNQGTDIEWPQVQGLFGKEAHEIVSAGRLCGVLQLSTEHDPSLVRFIHHRAQEFFTAYYITHSDESLSWDAYLDIPRWQETIINISQMDDGKTPISELTESLALLAESFTSQIDNKQESTDVNDQESDGKAEHASGEGAEEELEKVADNWLSLIDKAALETRLAERVDFAGRVVAVIPDSQEKSAFENTISEVINTLSEEGNPISKIKMLRTIQRIPHLGLRDLVNKLLSDKVNWVKEQAQIVSANLADSPSTSNLPIDTLNAFGDGSILSSIGRRLSVAKQVKSKQAMAVILLAALIVLIQCVLYSSVPIVLAWFSPQTLMNFAQANGEVSGALGIFIRSFPYAVIFITVLISFWSVVSNELPVWSSLIGGVVTFLVLLLIFMLWIYAPKVTLGKLLLGIIVVSTGIYVLYLVLSVVFFVAVVIIWSVTVSMVALIMLTWIGEKSVLKKSFSISWYQSELDEFSELAGEHLGGGIGLSIGFVFLFFIGVIFGFVGDLFSDWGITPFFRAFSDGIVFFLRAVWDGIVFFLTLISFNFPFVGLFWDIVVSLVLEVTIAAFTLNIIKTAFKRLKFDPFNPLKDYLWIPMVVYVLALVISYIPELVFNLLISFWKYISVLSGAGLLRTILVLLITGIVLVTLYYFYTGMVVPAIIYFKRKFGVRFRQMDLATFKEKFKEGDGTVQCDLLNEATPELFGMQMQTFYELLLEMEPFLGKEPGSSKYYQIRAKLEEQIRQERS